MKGEGKHETNMGKDIVWNTDSYYQHPVEDGFHVFQPGMDLGATCVVLLCFTEATVATMKNSEKLGTHCAAFLRLP